MSNKEKKQDDGEDVWQGVLPYLPSECSYWSDTSVNSYFEEDDGFFSEIPEGQVGFPVFLDMIPERTMDTLGRSVVPRDGFLMADGKYIACPGNKHDEAAAYALWLYRQGLNQEDIDEVRGYALKLATQEEIDKVVEECLNNGVTTRLQVLRLNAMHISQGKLQINPGVNIDLLTEEQELRLQAVGLMSDIDKELAERRAKVERQEKLEKDWSVLKSLLLENLELVGDTANYKQPDELGYVVRKKYVFSGRAYKIKSQFINLPESTSDRGHLLGLLKREIGLPDLEDTVLGGITITEEDLDFFAAADRSGNRFGASCGSGVPDDWLGVLNRLPRESKGYRWSFLFDSVFLMAIAKGVDFEKREKFDRGHTNRELLLRLRDREVVLRENMHLHMGTPGEGNGFELSVSMVPESSSMGIDGRISPRYTYLPYIYANKERALVLWVNEV